MRTVLAIVVGSNDLTVATVTSPADVADIDASATPFRVRIGDDARLLKPGTRVGDPVPIFTSDGSSSTGARLVAHAIGELAERAAYDAIVVVRPSTWTRYATGALNSELQRRAVSAVVVDSATVADNWLRCTGVIERHAHAAVVVEVGEDETVVSCSSCEAGATGVVTEPGSDAFGAVAADAALLAHVADGIAAADPTFDISDPRYWNDVHDLSSTISTARHRLDATPVVEVSARIGGNRRTIRVVRSEFEDLISADLARMSSRVAGTVAQFQKPVDAVVVHGAAASIPSVVAALSARTRRAVLVAPAADQVVVKGALCWGVSTLAPQLERSTHTTSPAEAPRKGSAWTRARVWVAGSAAALLLLGGGFAAAQTMTTQEPSAPSTAPPAHVVGFQQGR